MNLSEVESTVAGMDDLTERQRDLLDFERAWRFRYAGAKDTAIRTLFDCSPTRYYFELGAVIDLPAALVCDPVTTNRLRRLRQTRQDARQHPATG